jgi:hypothetical protein
MVVLALRARESDVEEFGGWFNLVGAGLDVAYTWSEDDGYLHWSDQQVIDLLAYLANASLIVGYDLGRYDYQVLAGYGPQANDLYDVTFDVQAELALQWNTGEGLSLGQVAARNLRRVAPESERLKDRGAISGAAYLARRKCETIRRLVEAWEQRGVIWTVGQNTAVWPGYRATQLVLNYE